MSFFHSKVSSRTPHDIPVSHPLRLLWPVTGPQVIFIWWPWQLWEILVRHFVKDLTIGIHLMFVSWLDQSYGSLRGRPQRYSAIFITSYRWDVLSAWLTPVDVDLGHLAEAMFVRLLHYTVTLFSPFHTVLFGRRPLCTAHTWGEEGCAAPPWEEGICRRYLKFLCMEECVYSPPFSYFFDCFIYLYRYGLMSIYWLLGL